ncbi:DUF4864 domain-containing protein [Peteryoungia desertarenae]|uniref:DUF4864 domain-containing protein n=1 Tax=Peteryoungia desertarenae TaxID=1813451 RepID=A0ABX6QPM6_9HYPH|nr:DUF4864 domain-containing protein [Peteryoungia desertarenae]QLF70468.1 DUF4864 domain-containing protein [Peteryoungia desertarenae]
MHTVLRVIMLWFAVSLLALPAKAEQDAVREAQSVISRQIEAFLADDATTAYSFASPEIKSVFPNAERFFDMVKKSYAPVFRPGNYAFGRHKVTPDGESAYQEVLISAPDGKDWAVFYELKRQRSGTFAINGVRMVRETGSQGI